jgi:hypothetical protein
VKLVQIPDEYRTANGMVSRLLKFLVANSTEPPMQNDPGFVKKTHLIRLSQDEDLFDDRRAVVVGEPGGASEVGEVPPAEVEIQHLSDEVDRHDKYHEHGVAEIREVAPTSLVLPVMVPQAHQVHHFHVDRQEVVVRRLVRRKFSAVDLKLLLTENICIYISRVAQSV